MPRQLFPSTKKPLFHMVYKDIDRLFQANWALHFPSGDIIQITQSKYTEWKLTLAKITNINIHKAQVSTYLQIFTLKFVTLERSSQGCSKLKVFPPKCICI